jgi:hypothetical protein
MQMSIEHENFTNLQQSKFNFDLRSIGMESERTECNFNLHRKQLELELESESKLESIVEMKMEMLESESESKGIAISEINRNRSFAISEMNWNQSSWERERVRERLWEKVWVRERGSEFVREGTSLSELKDQRDLFVNLSLWKESDTVQIFFFWKIELI